MAVATEARKTKRLKKILGRYSPDQELQLFAKWTSESIWVPPKDNSTQLAMSMLNQFSPFTSKEVCWDAMVKEHRSKFTQVREIELPKPSIRLPQGRLFVSVTERKDFDKIDDPIPNCVRTRLEEFLSSEGMKRGAKVYYLKPLCVESDQQLIFTTREQLNAAIAQIQDEVFAEYRRMYLGHRAQQAATRVIDMGLAIPRWYVKRFLNRKKREIDDYHAKLEYERRQRALLATQAFHENRTTGCTFDEMLALLDPPEREDVIEQYVRENELSNFNRQTFLLASAVTAATLPWFVALSVGIAKAVTVAMAASVVVCDPVFVAEIPDCEGALFKIGHFDEVDGVMHVEI